MKVVEFIWESAIYFAVLSALWLGLAMFVIVPRIAILTAITSVLMVAIEKCTRKKKSNKEE